MLGEYLVAQGVRFTAIYSGELVRQQQTAEQVRQAYLRAGLDAPKIRIEPLWNEFDLDCVYRDLAPILSNADPKFRADYEELQRQARDLASPIHRTWSPWIRRLYARGRKAFTLVAESRGWSFRRAWAVQ